jgi:TetR/AcrR family transcriptional regulator, transcriptional repressor of bet genes
MIARRAFKRAGEEVRRAALIAATLECIAEGGAQAATVRAIALRAGVTPGLIRHYFASKEELLAAALESLMAELTEASTQPPPKGSPRIALRAMILAALSPPVAAPQKMALWAAMIQLVPHDPMMRAAHARSYLAFRDRLEARIVALLASEGRCAVDSRALAIAANALLDGLWLEMSALPDHFTVAEMNSIAISGIEGLLQISLEV